MKTTEYIAFTIDRRSKCYVFTYADFGTEVDRKQAVIKAMNRMAASGKIAKLSKGRYYKSENTLPSKKILFPIPTPPIHYGLPM